MLTYIIKHPILATVISIIIILLGMIGLGKLPITRFPEIAPPSVEISVNYPGASAKTVAEGVLIPLEESVNGVDKMKYITSKSSNGGNGTIFVYFEPGTNPGQAAVDVQTRVSKASDQIPKEVVEAGISVVPRQRGTIMTIDLYSENKDSIYDETFLQAYSRINLVREILRVPGVAEVNRVGSRDYSMRIWLNPERMAAYEITPQEVTKAIKEQSFEIAPGKFGEESDEVFEIPMEHVGRFSLPNEYENIPVRKNRDGSIIFLKDISRIEFGASNVGSDNSVNGMPGITLNLTQTAGSNVRDIDIGVREKLEDLSETFPSGIKYKISYAVKDQIDQAIDQVKFTLFEAVILVFLVVYIFLQDIRITIIPIIAIPISLIGTLFFIYLLGFSLNVLTMFALVLSIGIVVDNAIIVVEAIHEKIHKQRKRPLEASIETISELGMALFAITMVMAAVFIPVGFMEGPTGVFYKQFAYTLAIAIVLSAVVAFTLTPALSGVLLKDEEAEREKQKAERKRLSNRLAQSKLFRDKKIGKKLEEFDSDVWKEKGNSLLQRFFNGFNRLFDEKFMKSYEKTIKKSLNFPKITSAIIIVTLGLGTYLISVAPASFIPTEDDSFLTFSQVMQPGASLKRTKQTLDKADSIISKRKDVESLTTISGYNTIDANASSSFAVGYINLKPYRKRGKLKNIDKIREDILEELSVINEASFQVFPRPTVDGFGNFSGIEFVIEDRFGAGFEKLEEVTNDFIVKLNNSPEIADAFTSFNSQFPQYGVDIDFVKAKSMGVSTYEVMSTIQAYFGRVQAGDFSRFGRQYRVYIQADAKYRTDPSSFSSIYVKNDNGEMVPISTLVKLSPKLGPETVRRQNLYNAIAVKASLSKGYSTGDAMKRIAKEAEDLPGNYKYEYMGMSKDEEDSSGQAFFIFGISILFVYFLLAGQYNSWLLPIAILLAIPAAFVGVFIFIKIAGLDNNIYVQVGLIMLIGLLAKNSILIVEYGLQRRKEGLSIFEASVQGAKERVRPILMTSFAFIMGLVPLMWTVGPSAMGNHSISFSTAGGMLAGVISGIYFVPFLFFVFQKWDEKLKSNKKQMNEA